MFFEVLNPTEVDFFHCLEKVDKESIWGLAIENVVKTPDVARFRRLVCDLKSQADDNAEVMKSILGEECYNTLITL